MADALFSEPRLAELYDPLDADRRDLDAYLAMAAEFGAATVVDIGCGTGTLACLMAQRGLTVTGVDPAAASLEVARRKPGADLVRWLHADATAVPPLGADLVTMTGNVAQVFVTDREWAAVLRAIRRALRPGGLAGVREPGSGEEGVAGVEQATDLSPRRHPRCGPVQTWMDLTGAGKGLVSFRSTVVFASDGAVLTSDSTLRFRERAELAGLAGLGRPGRRRGQGCSRPARA